MKIAVISDVHGNVVALEAVLADLKKQGGADLLMLPGDFFAFGPTPTEVYQLILTLDSPLFLMGNTDRYLLEKKYPSSGDKEDWQDTLLLSFRWCAEQIGDAEMAFIANLPPFKFVEAGKQNILFVHGSPRSDEEGLTTETSVETLREMSLVRRASILVGGHTHIPVDRIVGNTRLVNVGSVGIPFDGDPRACYAILSNLDTADPRAVDVDLRRVEYNVEAAVQQLYDRSHPAADIGAYNFRKALPVGSDLIYTDEMRQANQIKAEL